MSNRLLLIIFIGVTSTIVSLLLFVFPLVKWEGSLVSPRVDKVSSQQSLPTPVPSYTPKEIKYDSATNLKDELETVNPKVLDDDFSDMNQIIDEL